MNDHPSGERNHGFQFSLLWLVSLVTVAAVLSTLMRHGYDGAILAALLLGALLGRIRGRHRYSKTIVRLLWSAGLAAVLCFIVCICDPRLGSERTDIRALSFGGGAMIVMGMIAAAVLELVFLMFRIVVRYARTFSRAAA